MSVSIGVWRAKSEQICFLDSCGVIYEKIEDENRLRDFSHVFLFDRVPKNSFKTDPTIIDFCRKTPKKFVASHMLYDEQIDLFSFVGDLSLITSVPMNLTRRSIVIRKGFFIGQKKLPAEEIPLRDLGGLQRLFILALAKLFHSQNLPLTLKSFSPDPEKNVLLFRNDTDFSDGQTIENYYAKIKNPPVISWFVHCKVFEKQNSKTLFSAGESDEFALHCYAHKVKPTNENLEKGIAFLKKHGKNPLGYCAPFGVRDAKTDAYLKRAHNFEYSSDFSFAADALPFFVEETGLWQIPVFPLCVGSFNGVCDDEDKITAVFERYFARQFRYKLPFIVYDHPDHQKFQLLNKILEKAYEYPVLPMTFLEYSRFLEERKNAAAGGDFPVITFHPQDNSLFCGKSQENGREKLKKISRFSPRLIKNTLINRLRRPHYDS